jgi:hypothetical protein
VRLLLVYLQLSANHASKTINSKNTAEKTCNGTFVENSIFTACSAFDNRQPV